MKSNVRIMRFSISITALVPLGSIFNVNIVHGDSSCSDPSSSIEGSCFARIEPYCGLYLAESTIPGAGLGIFTAEAKKPGDAVGVGDICIPVIDMYWHNGEGEFFNPYYDYFWNGHTMGMSRECDTDDIEAFCPGLDCAINCNLALINVDSSKPPYDDGGLHRSKDPGVGAFSPYGNGTTFVIRDIPPGGELFKDYGDHWFTHRKESFGLIPLSDDFAKSSRLLKTMVHLNIVRDENKHDVFKEFYEDIILNTINENSWETRTLNALPKSSVDAKTAGEAGDVSVIYQKDATRDITWLAENGKCIDHIRSGKSTIKQAGHGAFAKRNLPAGTVITASPLHHIPDYSFMNMYNFTQQRDADGKIRKDKWYRLVDEVRNLQILNNYCFGHRESTVLLCPYGAGINYINHNRSLANVKIRWAQEFDIAHSPRLVSEGTIEELASSIRPQLAFDYVATRDITEGDELFMDYGDIWEEAWLDHVKNYQPFHDYEHNINPFFYSSAHHWNKVFGNHPLRTNDEQIFDPYPKNLQMRCHQYLLQIPFKPDAEFVWEVYDYGFPCRILDRFTESETTERENFLYTVQIEWDGRDDDEEHDFPASSDTVTWIERTDVPRAAIRFFDMPYTTDIHLVNSFRQVIQIPDDMFPNQWENVQEN